MWCHVAINITGASKHRAGGGTCLWGFVGAHYMWGKKSSKEEMDKVLFSQEAQTEITDS